MARIGPGCIHLTLSSETSVTKPSGPAIEGSSTSVFAPLTEFNASTKERLASSLSNKVSTASPKSTFEFPSAVDEGIPKCSVSAVTGANDYSQYDSRNLASQHRYVSWSSLRNKMLGWRASAPALYNNFRPASQSTLEPGGQCS